MGWNQCCAKLVGFEANIGFEIEISQKYRYRIGIGYETARIWTSILILFPNFELIDIGFDIGFELLKLEFCTNLGPTFSKAFVVKYWFRNRYRFEISAKNR